MIIGVDVGTSVTKAALIDHIGRTHAVASRRSHLERTADGRVEQDLEDVLASVAAVVREVSVHAAGHVEAIALTGQGDGLWLRDADGRGIRPAISWLDARATDIVGDWHQGAPSVVDRVFRLTGSGLFPGSQAALLAALQRDEPDALASAAVAGYCTDAVLQRLTGIISVDASDASLPFLDVTTRRYSQEALAACGMERWAHLLPTPADPLTVFSLDAGGAALLGLPIGTPVTAGPYDLVACGYGAGLHAPGDATIVLGTTLSCQALTTEQRISESTEAAGMWLCTPDAELLLRVMPSMVGTAGLDWLLTLLGRTHADVDAMLSQAPPGADGVRALSFLSPAGERAPFVDVAARGRFDGLTVESSPAALVRALCESIVYLAKWSLSEIGAVGDLAICGGGSRSDAWVQIFADVLGREVSRPVDVEIGARGAARIAWRALGAPVDDAVWDGARAVFSPDPAAAEMYAGCYERYLRDLVSARREWAQ